MIGQRTKQERNRKRLPVSGFELSEKREPVVLCEQIIMRIPDILVLV